MFYEENMKILTVVIPSYNAEAYLCKNLDSLCIEEILLWLEIIIINDGSKDTTSEIAHRYQSKYPNSIKVIDKENGGHGSGINTGISHATGTYFKVIDADDWVNQEAFDSLINRLRNSTSDIVYSGFLWAYDNGSEITSYKEETKKPFKDVCYGKQYQFDTIANDLYIKMHNMTIKTEILREHHITVDEHCFYVDTEYITYPIPYVKTIEFLDQWVYMYRIGNAGQSVSLEKMQQYESNYDQVIQALLDFYRKLGKEIPCSEEKIRYVAKLIGRVLAGKMKVMLSYPNSKEQKDKMIRFELELKKNYPQIYEKNQNTAIKILRKTNYVCYPLAGWLVKRKY